MKTGRGSACIDSNGRREASVCVATGAIRIELAA